MSSFLWSTNKSNETLDNAFEEIVKNTAKLNVEQKIFDKATQVSDDFKKSFSSSDENNDVDNENNDADNENNDADNENNDADNENNDADNENNDVDNENNDVDNENNDVDNENNDVDNESNESYNEDFDTESYIDTYYDKSVYVISVNGRPLYYNDNTLDARRLMWSVARRITQNLFLTGNYNVRISPETDDKLKVFSVSKFAIFSYERLEHTITCKKSVQASVLKN
jgi:hypothetical protein